MLHISKLSQKRSLSSVLPGQIPRECFGNGEPSFVKCRHLLQYAHKDPRNYPDSYGIFRLTEPGGLETILKCKNPRSFHEHADVKGGIYTDADHGHVKLREGPLEVIDLRRR